MIPCLFLLQIPLAYLTSFPFMRGQLGNVIVWASIVLGQPLAILMYMVEYYRYINWTVLATPQLSSFHSMQYYYNSVGYCCRPVWCFTSARIFSTVMQSLYMYSVLHDIHVNNYQLFWNDYIKKNHTNLILLVLCHRNCFWITPEMTSKSKKISTVPSHCC